MRIQDSACSASGSAGAGWIGKWVTASCGMKRMSVYSSM